MKYLFGASGHAKVIIDVINSRNEYKVSGIFDDDERKKEFSETPFLGKYAENHKFLKNPKFLISIGNNRIRKFIVNIVKHDFFSAYDKSSIISNSAKIGLGTVVMPNVIINANSIIGRHCIVNTAAVIEHDCIIEDFVHVSPSTTITGNVKVGEGTLIGTGSVVIPNIKIGKWCVVGAGTVITKDIPDYAVVVGNPGNIIKYNDEIK